MVEKGWLLVKRANFESDSAESKSELHSLLVSRPYACSRFSIQCNNNINSKELCNTFDISGTVQGGLYILTHESSQQPSKLNNTIILIF